MAELGVVAKQPDNLRLRKRFLLVARLSAFLVYLALGLLLALMIGAFFVQNRPWQQPFIRAYCLGLCRVLRLKITEHGEAPRWASLVVSNHVSWLDIPVLLSRLENVSFLSKSEVRKWPLIGILGVAAGTIFIRRGGGQADMVSQQLTGQLAAGRKVVLFPEGTTTVGETVLPFHSKLFSAAVHSGVPVQPALLRYPREVGQRDIAPFVGDDDFRDHLCRLLTSPPVELHLHWLPSIQAAAGEDMVKNHPEIVCPLRNRLAASSHSTISEALQAHQGRMRA